LLEEHPMQLYSGCINLRKGLNMHRIVRALFATSLLALSACVAGIKENGQGAARDSFHAPTTYQEAYRRADAFARHCHANTDWFKVAGNLYTDNQTGVVHITAPSATGDLERIDIATAKDGGSDVTVTAWSKGIWDAREIAAARQSIETGTPVCRSEMARS